MTHFQAGTEILGGAPRWLPFDAYSIPRELTADPSWYPGLIRPKAGKVGTWDKIPANPQTAAPAKWSNPATRCAFPDAWSAYERDPRFGCIGYMLHADAGVVGIDLDHSVSPDGTIAPWAQEIVDSFPGAYWERSISGTGLRGFCRGNLGDVGGVRSKIEGCSVEVYADVRFLVVTGQALTTVEQLPDLQAPIDALRARLTAGRVRATGTAIGSGLTGPNTSPSAEVLAIVESVMSGRYGQRLGEIWMRDALHVAGASEDDWALECEIAYQAIRLGHRGDDLGELVEQTMRAGPYRAKWDERRAGVTWLAQDVANAIATTQKRLGDRPITAARPDGLVDVDDQTPTDETPEQIIARLERELANERTSKAVLQTRLRAAEARNEQNDGAMRLIGGILARPNDELKPDEKIMSIGLTIETHYRADRAPYTLPDGTIGSYHTPSGAVRMTRKALAARTGYSLDRAAAVGKALCKREGAPFAWNVRNVPNPIPNAEPPYISMIEITPYCDGTSAALAQVLTMPAVPGRARHGGSPEAVAAAADERECRAHTDPNDHVLLDVSCAEDGNDLDRIVTPLKFWRRAKRQLDVSLRKTPPPVLETSLKDRQVVVSLAADERASVLNRQVDGSDERAVAMAGLSMRGQIDPAKRLRLVPSPDAVAERGQAYLDEWAAQPSPFDHLLLVAGASDEQPPGTAPPDDLDGRDPETGIPWGFV